MLHLCSQNVVKILRWLFFLIKMYHYKLVLRQILALALSHVFEKHKLSNEVFSKS